LDRGYIDKLKSRAIIAKTSEEAALISAAKAPEGTKTRLRKTGLIKARRPKPGRKPTGRRGARPGDRPRGPPPRKSLPEARLGQKGGAEARDPKEGQSK
jgi:hypothetical protein